MSLLKYIALLDIPEREDKLLEDYSIRISPRAKHALAKMKPELKAEMAKDVRKVLDGYIGFDNITFAIGEE